MRKAPVSHFPRSKKYLEAKGYMCGKVEMPWNQYSKVRQDLFGIFDMIAVEADIGIVGVQITNNKHAAEHRVKIMASANATMWELAGGRILMLSWEKKGNKWIVKEEWIKTMR